MMSSYYKYYESLCRGYNTISQGSGYPDNVSLRNDGLSELHGDTYITNNGRLMINKDKKKLNGRYYLDVSWYSPFNGKILLYTQITLSNMQYITGSTTIYYWFNNIYY